MTDNERILLDAKRHLTALVVDGEVANERWALLTALSVLPA